MPPMTTEWFEVTRALWDSLKRLERKVMLNKRMDKAYREITMDEAGEMFLKLKRTCIKFRKLPDGAPRLISPLATFEYFCMYLRTEHQYRII